ncbi:hypothetical protein BKG83_05465 [Mycobacteroides chelonae]|jgi:hypothetical protein|uniref:Uncharacterized protein n=1 Tax=Mycobacteroides chelonae TaxID=1774 RepID=A0A1S1LWY5_MYCCH|nr:hypothetical protein [Mycobacteroides chelonae]PKQ59400.1 hypothetical protein B5566_03670 [Mycobacterium sp. MHSD3]SKO40750.1 Uncharacterised protein [Mycobacteroides abscessus subsp. bolletii]MBF9524059.1 hypothetical protein [Mycobacteroides chelonae]OHU57179.1 hypothetical protein BKG83_05465 [Mycobacteroides chelonae]OHU75861.1 hypothetical protein BKG84_26130 [Mycobacteroides chelonae]
MSDELERDLDLIRSVADRSVMDIEAAGREAAAELKRQLSAARSAEPQQPVKSAAPPPTEFDEDDYYQFHRYRR